MNKLAAPRDVRRAVYAQERSERTSGQWSPFTAMSVDQIKATRELTNERHGPARGWMRDINRVYHNGWCSVIIRTLKGTSLGVDIDHAAIQTALGAELGWKEMQRVKSEIFGRDRMAVEVYPRQEQLIDAADMYHLWVFPEGYSFDFGLGKGQR